MDHIATLTAVTLVTFFGAPCLLGKGRWRLHWPTLCLGAWNAMFIAGLGCSVATLVLSVRLGIAARRDVTADWGGPTAATLTAWASLMIAGGLISLVSTRGTTMVLTERQLRRTFERLSAHQRCRQEQLMGVRVAVIDSDAVIICSLRWASEQILISRRVTNHLTPDELRAVLAHERAHLRGWHDVLTRLAALNSACVPSFATPRQLNRTTTLLIELIADRASARETSREAVASALRSLAHLTPDPTLTLRAELISN